MKMTKHEKEARRAYGDSHNLKGRNLKWKGEFISAGELAEFLPRTIPSYNCFEGKVTASIIKQFPKLQFALAREGSVCLYVKGYTNKMQLDIIRKAFYREDRVDEIHLVKGGKITGNMTPKVTDKLSLPKETPIGKGMFDFKKEGAEEKVNYRNWNSLPFDLRDTELRLWWD